MIKTTEMTATRTDRLSALVSRFEIEVTPTEQGQANLAICQKTTSDAPDSVLFYPIGNVSKDAYPEAKTLFLARASWGGAENPLIAALPHHIEVDIGEDPEMQSLAMLLISENRQQRCGSKSVINRLGEILLVRLLRVQLSAGTTDVGLLGGLADTRLSPAIVAMHEHPGQHWRVEQLAEIAGLSTSRFADRFTKTVGQTPMAYLRHWRMVLARQDVEQGDRIQSVANRYGYTSSEAMSRAFKRHFGSSPIELRPTA